MGKKKQQIYRNSEQQSEYEVYKFHKTWMEFVRLLAKGGFRYGYK
jgi:hypothetical protein